MPVRKARRKCSASLLGAVLGLADATAQGSVGTPPLKVSENKRFLVTADGRPFFWLGDTAWELFHRLNREEAERYLRNRAERRFTVIQAVALAELDGLNDPNAYGQRPLLNNDPTDPGREGWPGQRLLGSRGLHRGQGGPPRALHRLPADLGRQVEQQVGRRPGDLHAAERGALRRVARPALQGHAGHHLDSRRRPAGRDRRAEGDHPRDGARPARRGRRRAPDDVPSDRRHRAPRRAFHDDDWLDFNMRQNGHVAEFTGRYDQTRADYDRTPVKPVLDGEPIYEDHPVSFDAKRFGHSIAGDVRRPLYWDLFGGAFGHTYGHHSVWQMWAPGRSPINNPLMPWYDAIDQPGAAQMQHARALLESRPFLTRIPDDDVIVHRTRCRRACRAQGAITSPPRAMRTAATRWSTPRWAGRSPCAWARSPARR